MHVTYSEWHVHFQGPEVTVTVDQGCWDVTHLNMYLYIQTCSTLTVHIHTTVASLGTILHFNTCKGLH